MAFWYIDGVIEVNGKSIPVRIESLRRDRIYATREVANEFGVTYQDNLAISCDISEAVTYVNTQDANEAKEFAEKERNHNTIDFIHNL